MDYFFEQYKHNSEILLDNVSKKFNIDRKLTNKLIPTKLSKKQEEYLSKLIENDKYNEDNGDTELDNCYFEDIEGAKYIIINNRKIKYDNIYDALKIN